MFFRAKGSAEWKRAGQVGFTRERELQALLRDTPAFFSSVGAVVVEEFPLSSGFLDLLAVGTRGQITLCECKLHRNAESRRTVVGQVLSYAGALGSLTWDEFLSRFAARAGCSLSEAAINRMGPTVDAEQLLRAARANLQARAFELVVALDRIPDELAGTLTYLRSQGNRVSGLEVELGSADDFDLVALRWIARSSSVSPPPVHSEATLLHALSKRCSPETVAAVLALRDGLVARGTRLAYGRGASPSLTFWVPLGEREQPLFTIYAYIDELTPSLEVAFAYLKERQATVQQLEQIASVVRDLPHAADKLSGLEASDYRRRPGLSLEDTVAAQGAIEKLLQLVDALQAGTRQAEPPVSSAPNPT